MSRRLIDLDSAQRPVLVKIVFGSAMWVRVTTEGRVEIVEMPYDRPYLLEQGNGCAVKLGGTIYFPNGSYHDV